MGNVCQIPSNFGVFRIMLNASKSIEKSNKIIKTHSNDLYYSCQSLENQISYGNHVVDGLFGAIRRFENMSASAIVSVAIKPNTIGAVVRPGLPQSRRHIRQAGILSEARCHLICHHYL